MSEPEDQPSVSVIVPVYNDEERLSRCIEALDHQNWPTSDFEIIVADNGSTPPVEASGLKASNLRVIQVPEPGSYAARNGAVRVAKGNVYAFTDSDCIPDPGWLEAGIEALSSGDCDFVGGRVRLFARNPVRPSLVETYEMLTAFDQVRYAREGFSVTANLFATASLFADVGDFDSTLRSNGDREWGERATARGHRVVFCEEAVVDHPARRTLGELRRKVTRVVGGRHARGKPIKLENALRHSVVPYLNRMRRAYRRAGGHGLRAQLTAGFMRMIVEYFRAWEALRLHLGGAPRR